eukprot:gene2127-4154_t
MSSNYSGEPSIDHIFKIVIVGDAGVGKSSIMLQFTDGYFDNGIQSTIGVDFKFKILKVDDSLGNKVTVKVIIWDTAGQERFRTLTSSYYRGAQAIILGIPVKAGNIFFLTHNSFFFIAYDVTRKETFDNLNTWLQEIEQYSTDGGRNIVKVLVGNKVDKERAVPREVADSWARAHAMLFLEVSAKTKEGISQIFAEVVQKVLDNPVLVASAMAAKPGGKGNADLNKTSTDTANKSGGCC